MRKCVGCGMLIAVATEIIFCHDCMKKIHQNPHLPGEGFAHEQLYGPINTSGITASASVSTFDSEHLKNTNFWELFNN